MDKIIEKMNRLEYHQSLLLEMIPYSSCPFYRLIIENSLSKNEVEEFHQLCQMLSELLEVQRSEGFVYFKPLYKEFSEKLNKRLPADEVIHACLKQKLYVQLMKVLEKYCD
ncbi:DUF1878 family protein [Bacillaceae bacterium Marseille-Q3522]|nr:DUF1878 family protein [Bacillaceae bacterium Marseille-Q3522]